MSFILKNNSIWIRNELEWIRENKEQDSNFKSIPIVIHKSNNLPHENIKYTDFSSQDYEHAFNQLLCSLERVPPAQNHIKHELVLPNTPNQFVNDVLQDLDNGKEECNQQLASTLRSLQKDMIYVKEFLADNLSKQGNCYQLIKQDSLDDFFQNNHEKIRKLFHAISLIDSSVFGKNFKKYTPLLESIKTQQKEVYLFLENPFENLKQLELKKRA